MKQEILLKQLKFHYFKGIKEIELNFDPTETTVQGDNGIGKSSIFGGFSFLLFGKDQFNSEKSEDIKTYDSKGKHLEKLDHSVEGTFLINGQELILKRVLREVWSKPRGQVNEVLTGHKTFYFVNGTSCGTETEFKNEVAKIIDEKTFRLLTNPHYFNDILTWQERREILMSIAPPISDDDVIKKITNSENKDRISSLTNILNSGRSLEQKKTEISAKKKEIKDELDRIPARIDTATSMKPELPEDGFDIIEGKITTLQEEIKSLDYQISDKSKANEELLNKEREKQQYIHQLKTKLQEAGQKSQDTVNSLKQKQLDVISDIENKIASVDRNITSLQKEIDDNNKSIKTLNERKRFAENRYPELEKEKQSYIDEFNNVNDEVFEFDPEKYSCPCPTCKREFTSNDIQSLRDEFEKAFNIEKSKRLDHIDAKGLVTKGDIDKYQKSLEDFDAQILENKNNNKELESKIKEAQDQKEILSNDLAIEKEKLNSFDIKPEQSEEEKELESKIKEAQDQKEIPAFDYASSLIELKNEKQEELDNLKSLLSRRDTINKADEMIKGFQKNQRKLSQDLANLEKDEDIIQEFTKTRIESIEERISGLFSIVKFKLFDTKINGNEKECCEATIDGVPYKIANTASKVNAGLDVINALCEYYGTIAPIFIDNRESISRLIPTKSQIINLEKVEGLNQLTVK